MNKTLTTRKAASPAGRGQRPASQPKTAVRSTPAPSESAPYPGLQARAGPRRLSAQELFRVPDEGSALGTDTSLQQGGHPDEAGVVGAALAQQRLRTWVLSETHKANANHGIDAQLFSLGRVAAERLALQNEILSEHVTWSDQKHRTHPLVGGDAKLPCFGACLVGPEVRGISVGLTVEHDAHGMPKTASITLPSRRATFDQGACSALQQAIASHQVPFGTRRGPVRKTCWLLVAHVYHWRRESLLTDPQFTPPGNKVDNESGLLTLATLASSAWLTGVMDDASDGRCF